MPRVVTRAVLVVCVLHEVLGTFYDPLQHDS